MYRRVPLSVEVKRVLKMLMYTIVSLSFFASAYFFVKTTNTAESGYAFRESQMQQVELQAQNRILKQRLLDIQSLVNLEESEVVEDMVKPEGELYVGPRGPLSRK